jgi:aminoglycoside phosphotransferase family enzyme/predicted kinase
MTSEDVIAAMSEPAFYPHRPERVEFRQTHISCVFLAGDYVYKIKKPLHLPFLDYSTLERRYHFCQEEVRLNQRLAPKVYLGVFAIVRCGDGFALSPRPAQRFNANAAEYAVKMRRLPDDRSLKRLITNGQVNAAQLQQIAFVLANFHILAARERSGEYGSADAIGTNVGTNLEECRPFIGQTISEAQFSFIKQFNETFTRKNRDLLDRRARAGWVREGHGDLRSEHVCITGPIEIIDCVEFSEELRYADIASDIGFLLMDLDRLGAPALGHELLRAYAAEIGDPDLSRLLNFYKCYRAGVRGKVGSLKALQTEIDPAQRSKARDSARTYFATAQHYAAAGSPALIVVCGLPASGKSTVAQALSERSGFEVFNSDVVRKGLAGIAPTDRADGGWGEGIYSQQFSRMTYQALADTASRKLSAGDAVIIDATYKDLAERARLRDLARQAGVPMVFAECVIPDDEARRRLELRAQRPDTVSDATWDTYLRHRASFAPFGHEFDGCHLRVDGSRHPAESAFAIESFIAGRVPVE